MVDYKQDKNEFQVVAQSVGRYQKLTLSGKLIYGQTNEAKEKIIQTVTDADGYIFDVSNLTMIDSTGFGVLITVAKQVEKQNCSIAVIVKSGMIRELFLIAKFDLIFSIVENEAEALQMLSGGTSSCLPLDHY